MWDLHWTIKKSLDCKRVVEIAAMQDKYGGQCLLGIGFRFNLGTCTCAYTIN